MKSRNRAKMFQQSVFVPILAVFLFLFPAFSFPGRGEQTGEEDQAGGKAAVAGADLSEPFGPGSFAGEKKVLTVRGIDYAFRWCPPGDFLMGTSNPAADLRKNNPLHRVRLTQGFWILETEVTQKMWKSVMGTDVTVQREKAAEQDFKEEGKDFYVLAGVGPNYPVYYVNWWEAASFCRRLSSLSGQTVQLPTSAQWEYACRAGTQTDIYSGDIEKLKMPYVPELDPIAWYTGNASIGYSGGEVNEGFDFGSDVRLKRWFQSNGNLLGTHEVGGKEPNLWGLHDTIGNVREWCSDWADSGDTRECFKYPYRSSVKWWKGWYSGPSYYHATDAVHTGFTVYKKAVPDAEDHYITVDPTGVSIDTGWGKFHRGGGWLAVPQVDTAMSQDYDQPCHRYIDLGFRAALIPKIPEDKNSASVVLRTFPGAALYREGVNVPSLLFEDGACTELIPPPMKNDRDISPAARTLTALAAQLLNERRVHQPRWVYNLLRLCGIEWFVW
ncbi:MAG: formylglycine-generating enzyme family protein [Thermoguttaceae bacterium]|nr:formylglycine-generating enzyme family protein [Thermoguttaceae bacterium]